MEAVICACAKNEQLYLEDWVNYHLNLGFDHIYIYDNSDSYETRHTLENDKVTYIEKFGDNTPYRQFIFYNDFYKNYKFDWCAFIDIDEYIVIPTDIKTFISQFPDDCNTIKLNWHIFGDDDKIERDMSKPIYDEIKQRVVGHFYEKNGKQIIKSGLDIELKSSHHCDNTNAYQADMKVNNGTIFEYRNCENAYVNHYITKTLSEYFNQKFGRSDVVFDKTLNLDYYWKVNKPTKEKIDWINNHSV